MFLSSDFVLIIHLLSANSSVFEEILSPGMGGHAAD